MKTPLSMMEVRWEDLGSQQEIYSRSIFENKTPEKSSITSFNGLGIRTPPTKLHTRLRRSHMGAPVLGLRYCERREKGPGNETRNQNMPMAADARDEMGVYNGF